MAMPEYWTTEDTDPRHLYHDVLIAIDEERRLNNGQPSLWARMYDQLGLSHGDHVVHVGAGTGYYSAILAEIVGRTGRVTAIEIDPALAARPRRISLRAGHRRQSSQLTVSLSNPTGRPGAIVVNAGVTHLSSVWLDALAAENGRLLVPLTNADRWGGFLMITRRGADPDRYAARFAGRVGIIPCAGGRDPAAEERLGAARAKSDFTAIRSLRRAPDEPDHTCWLAGEGWWLSTAPASSG
jgi:protein-L-isoaspartate(D-aspartate) O-methyltransferase